MSVITSGRPLTDTARRFVADVLRLHEKLQFAGLPDAITGDPLHVHDVGDGLLTVAVKESQLPPRYLKGILGFRLAQYLRLGWISPELVYRDAMFHEAASGPDGVQDVHIVSLSGATGRILGYVGLAGSHDLTPLPLDSPDRHLLATETAHRVDLLRGYAAPGWHTHQVFEVKRFLRDQQMPPGRDAALVPWHIVLGFGRTLITLAGEHRRLLAVGDAKERVALRHLKLMGLTLDVVNSTEPSLPTTDLMWPIYEQKMVAKPFIGRVPADIGDSMDVIESYLAVPEAESARDLVSALSRRFMAKQERRQA